MVVDVVVVVVVVDVEVVVVGVVPVVVPGILENILRDKEICLPSVQVNIFGHLQELKMLLHC